MIGRDIVKEVKERLISREVARKVIESDRGKNHVSKKNANKYCP